MAAIQARLEQSQALDWDWLDFLILSNWRELHIYPEIQEIIEAQEGKLPGLCDWSPQAIEGLFKLGKIKADCRRGEFAAWFHGRRQKLGLGPARTPYQIKNFLVRRRRDEVKVVR